MSRDRPPVDHSDGDQSDMNDHTIALNELADVLDLGRGQFSLHLVRCRYAHLRSRLAETLQHLCQQDYDFQLDCLTLSPNAPNLYTSLQDHLHTHWSDRHPDGLMVLGLEQVTDLAAVLGATESVREEFRYRFSFPLVLWLDDAAYVQVTRSAPNFASWSAGTLHLAISGAALQDALHQAAEHIYRALLDPSAEKLPAVLQTLNPLGMLRQEELCPALEELRTHGLELEAEGQAALNWAIAMYHSTHDSQTYDPQTHDPQAPDRSTSYYQQAVDYWVSQEPLERCDRQLRAAVAFFFMGRQLAWRLERERRRGEEVEPQAWQPARAYLEQAILWFRDCDRLDLVAKCISGLQRVLRRAEDWDALETYSQLGLTLHSDTYYPIKRAYSYGFLGAVALARQQWQTAKDYIMAAIAQLDHTPPALNHRRGPTDWIRGLYLLDLAEAERSLGQRSQAIAHLVQAREWGDRNHPTTYCTILEALRQMRLEQRHYLSAFKLKQARLEVEKNAGIRAFVGAGRLGLEAQAMGGAVAPELAASGRRQDLNRLMERLGRNDYKLIVIHGRSGVGKSSLLNAGLVPALQKRIDYRDNLVVVVRNYSSLWREDVATRLAEGLAAVGQRSSGAEVLTELRRNEARDLRTILMFDQFEEFFFANPDRLQWRQFFEFLGDCLAIPYVKVVLSLREDYLHYLLDANRLESMSVINHDILGRQVLYSLGNLSLADAQATIADLTGRSRFSLEPALVERLVQDLGGPLQEVRPIEMQIVGARLQTVGISTLAAYEQLGPVPKEALVTGYVQEVVEDCGPEHQQLAELVLFLLTDERGTRPLKTRSELVRELEALLPGRVFAEAAGTEDDEQEPTEPLDLVLRVACGSGLVMYLPEEPQDRYQLVHDYIAELIRQQRRSDVEQLKERLDQVEREKAAIQLELKDARQVLGKARQRAQRWSAAGVAVFVASAILTSSVVYLGSRSLDVARRATTLERAGVGAQQRFSFQQTESLLASTRALWELKQLTQQHGITELADYPAHSPWLATQTSVDQMQETQFEGHQRIVWQVQFSPDGKTIAASGTDGTARLWNLDGNQLAVMEGHQGPVYEVQFSPDGKTIATSGLDGTARLWDLDGNQIAVMEGHQGIVGQVQFSPDGDAIVTSGEDGTARLWDLEGNQLAVVQGDEENIYDVQFSPQGNTIATGGSYGTARLWDLDGNQIAVMEGHQGSILQVQFSPEGNMIATGGEDGAARLWDLDGNQIAVMEGHEESVWDVVFSPSGNVITTGSGDGTARLWDLDGNQLTVMQGHQGIVWQVQFSSEENTIATSDSVGTARLWDLDGNQLVVMEDQQGGSGYLVFSESNAIFPNQVVFSSDGDAIVTGYQDGTARLWDLEGNQLAVLEGHQGSIWQVQFSPEGNTIATRGDDGTARLWDLDGNQIALMKGHEENIYDVQFSPEGNTIATRGEDDTARLWDLDGNQIALMEGHEGSVLQVQFSPEGNTIATRGDDGTARLWDLNGNQTALMERHEGSVLQVQFSPEGNTIATSDSVGTAHLWDLDGNQIALMEGHEGSVYGLQFSPNGDAIATGGSDGTARLWDLDGNQIALLEGHEGSISDLLFSPNREAIATGGSDGTVRLWDLDGNQLELMEGHKGSVYELQFSPDGDAIATIVSDGTARLWDLDNNQSTLLEGHQGSVSQVLFSPDGETIATSDDNTTRIWTLNGQQIAQYEGHLGAFTPDWSHVWIIQPGNALMGDDPANERVTMWPVDRDIDSLLARACRRLRNYLIHSPDVSESDRTMCGLPPRDP